MTVGQLASFMYYSVRRIERTARSLLTQPQLFSVGALYGAAGLYGDLMKALGASSRVFEYADYSPLVSAKA